MICWKERFLAGGIDGLDTYHSGQKPTVLTPALRANVLAAMRKKAADGSTRWSCRKLAAALHISKDAVHCVWKVAGMQPHRLERYMASSDPDLETKAADSIGLYLHPGRHAAVFCVDEKTAIRAVDRLDPVLPLSPGRAERHGLEYYRDGTLSRYAALDTKTGKVVGKLPAATPARNSSPSSARCWSSVQPGSKSTSCWITSPHLKPKPVGTFSQTTPRCNCTSPRPTPPG